MCKAAEVDIAFPGASALPKVSMFSFLAESSAVHAAGSKQGVSEASLPQQELVLVMPAVLPKLHTLAQAMLRCRGSHVFKVTPYEVLTAVLIHTGICG